MKCAIIVSVLVSLCFTGLAYGQSYGKWFLHKKVDPIIDTISLFATVAKKSREQLIVSCLNEERLAVAIKWSLISPFGISLRNKRRNQEVIVRFDKIKPERMVWVLGKSGQSTFLSDAWDPDQIDGFVKKLKKYNQVVVRAEGMNIGIMTLAFSLKGSTYAIKMVEYICGLRKEKPKK